ncbi:DUF2798 domain-containing protein [Bacillus sp. ISL-18]|uniref:DUF2798 domain-containing protein n=1 Tax=Bacillus sp. ISL-18 TaxID=2819118 RepID=UPI001BEC6EC9|nr:DUF2798 domain-containing protein [Bacillus sp. ISL-18]MBT2655627.1 DUF2798 domain-containing protein [Bacillus sp. ISL-18]
MPTNKKESILFGTMMCFGMVFFMSVYNLFLNGLIGELSVGEMFIEGAIGFMIALLLDLFLVGPAAKKVALMLPYDKSKKVYVILAISFCMVVGMVLFMSLYGLGTAFLTNGGMTGSMITSYFSIVIKNFIVAFPLQLLIMGPIVRFLFVKIVKAKNSMSVA